MLNNKSHNEEQQARIKKAMSIIGGIHAGFCPCGYCGTIDSRGHCFKCGTNWPIAPKENSMEEILISAAAEKDQEGIIQ